LKWVLKESPDPIIVQNLMDVLGVPTVIAQILVYRGIKNFDEAESFFRTDWQHLYDPYLMQDMEKAVKRVHQAIKNKEHIFIYGDYDVDGITSSSLLYLFLTKMGCEVDFYIPNRLKEGYGLSETGIEQAQKVDTSLIITVDCGITAVEEVARARELGMDVIVSDHHEPGEELPNANAILDPKRDSCNYPFKELAGVGVAFKLVQAVSESLNLDVSTYREYVDLVALGSAADIVPLVDENRLLVKKGLEKLNQFDRIGIRALAENAGLSGKRIGTGQIVFILAPRINAVGRMGNAERAVRLLITDSEQQAKNIAHILESENRTRKSIDEETFQEAMMLIEKDHDLDNDRAVVLAQDGWHSGVIGIVASRVAEKICRPTIMISIENGIGKGSARSISQFDIYSALKKCEDHLVAFGGHKYAAGLTLEQDEIDPFREAFKKVAKEAIQEEDMVQKCMVDAEISLNDITGKLVRLLGEFAPFGPNNMRPLFISRDLQVIGSPRIVGKNHLKFRVRQNDRVFDAIGFDLGELHYRLSPGESNLDMVFVIEENVWNGQTKIQLRVKDLR